MARFLDKQGYINKFKSYNRNLKVRVFINWFNLEEEEPERDTLWFEDNIDRIDISRDIEGTMGTSVRDRGTIVLKDTEGNFRRNYIDGDYYEGDWNYVEPLKLAKVQVSLDGEEWLDYFVGLITDISTSRTDDNVVLDLDDPIIVLQEISVEDVEGRDGNYHYELTDGADGVRGKKISDILLGYADDEADKGLLSTLPLLDVDTQSIRKLNSRIIYNFAGMSLFEALQMMLELSHAYIYTKDFTLYVDSKMFITEEPTQVIETFSDTEDNNNVENIFELEENISEQKLYNDIRINYMPFDAEQSRQVVWTGGEEETDQSELYYGSDIENDTLVLTHDPREYEYDIEEGEPTRNVPIVKNSVGVSFGSRFYTDQDGDISLDYDEGIIYFEDVPQMPSANEEVEVLYRYHFNQIEPGKTREFYARLEHPCVSVEDIKDNLYARSLEKIDLEDEFGTVIEIESTTFEEEYISIDTGWFDDSTEDGTVYPTSINTIHPNAEEINIYLTVQASSRSSFNNDKAHNYQVYLVVDGERVGTVINHYDRGTNYERASFSYEISEDEQGTEFWLEYEVYLDGSNNFNFFKIYSFSRAAIFYRAIKTDGDFDKDDFDLSDQMLVTQNFYDDKQTVLVSITNKTHQEGKGYRVELGSKVYGQREDTMVIMGRPIIQSKSYKSVREVNPSLEHYNTRRKYEITNDLFKSEVQADRLVDFLAHQYSQPRSIMNLKVQCYPHIELLDRVQLEEKYRDTLKDFLITSISDTYQEGTWEQRVTLEEFDDSWEYEADFPSTPEFPDRDIDRIFDVDPVENLEASITHEMLPDNTVNYQINLSWDLPNNVNYEKALIYKIDIEGDEGDLSPSVITDNYVRDSLGNKATLDLNQDGLFRVYVRTENQDGSKLSLSNTPYIDVQVDKTVPTEGVGFDEIYWGADYIKITWHPHDDDDFDEYEVRLDDTDFGDNQ